MGAGLLVDRIGGGIGEVVEKGGGEERGEVGVIHQGKGAVAVYFVGVDLFEVGGGGVERTSRKENDGVF